MDKLPMCACEAFWDDHHPACPVRREIESLRSKLDRYRAALVWLARLNTKDEFEGPTVDALDPYILDDAIKKAREALDVEKRGRTELRNNEECRAYDAERGQCVMTGPHDECQFPWPARAEEGQRPECGHLWQKAGKVEDGDYCTQCGARRPAGGIARVSEEHGRE